MKLRGVIGLLFFTSSLGLFGGGAYILYQGLDRQRIADDVNRQIETACREQIVKLGKLTPAPNGVFDLEIDPGNDPRKALGDATSVLAMCPNRQILEACMGVGCASSTIGTNKLTLKIGIIQPGSNKR